MRERLRPQDAGLPVGTTRRTPGLRREEVAQPFPGGCSASWAVPCASTRTNVGICSSSPVRRGGAERNWFTRIRQHRRENHLEAAECGEVGPDGLQVIPLKRPSRVRVDETQLIQIDHRVSDLSRPQLLRDGSGQSALARAR
jgi:hypothetical protein